MKIASHSLIIIVVNNILFSSCALAGSEDVNFSGTLIDPPACVINQGADPYVNFGRDIITTRVDGVNYLQEANYSISCVSNVTNLLRMRLEGNAAGFEPKSIATTNADIGVAIYNGNSRLSINEWVNFTYPAKPAIKLVPIKRPGAVLKGGNFSGFVQFKVEYQ